MLGPAQFSHSFEFTSLEKASGKMGDIFMRYNEYYARYLE